MPTGSPSARQARGFTYLLLLFALVAGSSALAALATAWTTAAQRQRELESQFRGQQIADAIGRYMLATPADRSDSDGTAGPLAAAQGPTELAELLQDPRSAPTLRHLRRLYEDPLTGQADWVLLRNTQGRIEALHSRSRQPALLTRGLDGAALASDRIYRPRQGPVPMAAAPLPSTDGRLQSNGLQNAPPNLPASVWLDAPPMARSDYGQRAGHGKPSPQVASLGPAVAPRP